MMALLAPMVTATVLLLSSDASNDQIITRAFLDTHHNVHVIDNTGRESILTNYPTAEEPKISPNGKTAIWGLSSATHTSKNPVAVQDSISVYRDGIVRSIKCEPQIRAYWFWQGGEKIAIDCGGQHFSGREILYDAGTLVQLDTFDQAEIAVEARPSWSQSGDNFSGER
jgi:hypothetical protein